MGYAMSLDAFIPYIHDNVATATRNMKTGGIATLNNGLKIK